MFSYHSESGSTLDLPQTTLQHTATHCNTLQHTATHCNTLQQRLRSTSKHTATHCYTLPHTATAPQIYLEAHCNTLLHTATHCNSASDLPQTSRTSPAKYHRTHKKNGLHGVPKLWVSCRSFFAKEPLIIGLFCGKCRTRIKAAYTASHLLLSL